MDVIELGECITAIPAGCNSSLYYSFNTNVKCYEFRGTGK